MSDLDLVRELIRKVEARTLAEHRADPISVKAHGADRASRHRIGVSERVPEDPDYPDVVLQLDVERGWMGFFVRFQFDANGNLVDMGAWE
jgi:hypothetical protein